jgi:feruloyl esterase
VIVRRVGKCDEPRPRRLQGPGREAIFYHGGSDAAVPRCSTVNYYGQVVSKMGQKAADFSRLYMVPGLQHCGGGPGLNSFREPITASVEL